MGSNTKAYLISLLVCFLLLVHTSVAEIPGLGKIIKPTAFEIESFKPAAKRLFKINERDLPDTLDKPKGLLPQTIDGLDWVKAYLSDYGYMQYSDNFTELLDEEAVSSIKEYQKFFNLKVTGFLDSETIEHMSLLRCGVPDKNFAYDLSPTNNLSWPLGTTWFGFPNGRMNLTYGFSPETNLTTDMTKVFEDSFKRWTDAITKLKITKTKYEDADIKIVFNTFEDGTIGEEVVGESLIELESANNNNNNSRTKSNVTSGYMVLVAEKYSWALPNYNNEYDLSWDDGVVDLETVVMHQIGHLLGLEHSSDEESVMYPSILPSMQKKVKLSKDDKEQIHKVYSSSANRGRGVILFGSGWGLVTTSLSLGFAYMVVVLFY